jgi:hypothetical protein
MKLRIGLMIVVTWILWLFVSQYFFCARFYEHQNTPFEGIRIFNPYDSTECSGKWIKSNFHAHSRAWKGITNGHGSAADIHNAYQRLRYDVHCVSNYHYIDKTDETDAHHIPAYEHGYNLQKTHQLVLGSNAVQWLDYLLPQSFHNKQHVLQQLNDTNTVVILNHPGLRNGYSLDDFTSLTNYDCMEVLNPSMVSTREWDAALSAGKKVFIVGNDDIHDVIAGDRLGKMCTFVHTNDTGKTGVLSALRTGKSYGMIIGKNQPLDAMPALRKLSVRADSIALEMTTEATEIVVTGQYGRELARFSCTKHAKYRLQAGDHYARATCYYDNGTTLLLNPVFFTPETGYIAPVALVNAEETVFFRAMGAVIMVLWLVLIWRFTSPRHPRFFPEKSLSLR